MDTGPAGANGIESARSVGRALDLLEGLASGASPVGLSHLARETGFAKTTVHRLLRTLQDRRYVLRSGQHYVLGERLYELAYQCDDTNHTRLARILRPHLVELHQRTGGAVGIGVFDRGQVLFPDMLYDHSHAPFITRTTERGPLHGTAAGKVLIAYQSRAARSAWAGELERFTPATLVDPGPLQQQLRSVRRTGIAWAQDEVAAGRFEVAAPVFLRPGEAVATVTVIGHRDRLDIPRVMAVVRRTALTASRELWQDQTAGGTP